MIKKLLTPLVRVRTFWRKLSCKDRFLLGMMGLLLVQSACNLVGIVPSYDESDGVDIVVRTTAASIFGYFMGTAFLKSSEKDEPPSAKEQHRQRLQVTLVGILGMVSLVLFLVGKYFESAIDNYATMAQLRDFVSGSVGMLIGHNTAGEGEG